jgi:non-specific protein-tyrosine kinase
MWGKSETAIKVVDRKSAMRNDDTSKKSHSIDEFFISDQVDLDISSIWNAPTYAKSRRFDPDPVQMERERCVCMFSDSPVSDHYTKLRAQVLQRTREKGWRSIMITSPGPGTGKTVTAINLSLTLAKTCEDTVLLVDCDLKNQTICRYMGLPEDKGIVDVLLKGNTMSQVITWPGIDKMTIISGGQSIQASSELLGSTQMARLAADMKKRYKDRYVFFDVPACLQSADALTFSPYVDCILLVIEEGKTTHKEVEATLSMFPKEKILGYVINKKK